jgi:hypothetical protein
MPAALLRLTFQGEHMLTIARPRQMGLDMAFTDAGTQAPVPWAMPDAALLASIARAPWKVVDIETTGLNPASKERAFTGRDLRRGVSPELRLRVLSALIPTGYATIKTVAFDFDSLTPVEQSRVAQAAFSKAVIGHNVGFDAYWIARVTPARPQLLLDTMLLARLLHPRQPLELARRCTDEQEDEQLRREAEAAFMQGRSGWSLADLSAGVLRRVMAKTHQGPEHWCQPFLSQESYDYATGDARQTFLLLLALLGLEEHAVAADPALLLRRYEELKCGNAPLRLSEHQVSDLLAMRLNGMPWCQQTAQAYVEKQRQKVALHAQQLVRLEPKLAPFEAELARMDKGVSAELKAAVGAAFASRGLELGLTDKSRQVKIGEKDLRLAKAGASAQAKELFDAWVVLNRAKKAGGMAQEVSGFAARSHDGRLHPNTGHGPVTGRLSSSEPNCQQFPRDQGFRDCVVAKDGHLIVAADYSALDMRVGAALAIRAQRQILEVWRGQRQAQAEVAKLIAQVWGGALSLERAQQAEARTGKTFADWKLKRDTPAGERRDYWDKWRQFARAHLLAGFARCLAQVRARALERGTDTWGSLRDAFNIPGMDIHTWTALGMQGRAPQQMFGGLSGTEVARELKKCKAELGDKRQAGKVGNLSLLYAMKERGLAEAAAKNYDIHWSLEEALAVIVGWLGTYVEIDLWHKWTELNELGTVSVPDMERGGRYVRKGVFASYTLAERLVYAFGLNAALSYEDQSSGADILGLCMRTLCERHPEIAACMVNQVHDEIVFEVPEAHAQEYTARIQATMNECAEVFLMPYGVRSECSPAVGKVWLKD